MLAYIHNLILFYMLPLWLSRFSSRHLPCKASLTLPSSFKQAGVFSERFLFVLGLLHPFSIFYQSSWVLHRPESKSPEIISLFLILR